MHAEFLHSANFQPMWPCLVLKEAYFHAGSDKIGFRRIQSLLAELRAMYTFACGYLENTCWRNLKIMYPCVFERYYLPLLKAT